MMHRSTEHDLRASGAIALVQPQARPKRLLQRVLLAGLLATTAMATAASCSRPEPATAASEVAEAQKDPLPSWQDGRVKQDILGFIRRTTRPGSPYYVEPADRIAAFDHDGTLWQERPPAELAYVLERVDTLMTTKPELRSQQPFKAAFERDQQYFIDHGAEAILPLVLATQGGMNQDWFAADVASFFSSAKHPKFQQPYTSLTYKPMVELLALLRAHGYTTYISSGGDLSFIRVISEQLYGIPPENVIGSSVRLKVSETGAGEASIERGQEMLIVNDKERKAVGLALRTGKRPVFAAGNAGNAGDIAMLEYSKGRKGASMQLLINHDDAEREFAYQERDGASLGAAALNGFEVVSMKNDWAKIF